MNTKSDIKSFVGKKINILLAEADFSAGKAALAGLRRGVVQERVGMNRVKCHNCLGQY